MGHLDRMIHVSHITRCILCVKHNYKSPLFSIFTISTGTCKNALEYNLKKNEKIYFN